MRILTNSNKFCPTVEIEGIKMIVKCVAISLKLSQFQKFETIQQSLKNKHD